MLSTRAISGAEKFVEITTVIVVLEVVDTSKISSGTVLSTYERNTWNWRNNDDPCLICL